MSIRPGQLVLVKSDFEASEIPIDWAEERKLPRSQRETLRNIRVKKNEILLIVNPPQEDIFFLQYGTGTQVTRQMVTFLRGSQLCFMVTVVGFNEYMEPVCV